MADPLFDAFERMLADVSPPSAVRAIELGGDISPLWSAIEDSGFLDALVPEAADGAGLSFADSGILAEALGRHVVPAPVAQTMAARALIASAGLERPEGAFVLATPHRSDEGHTATAVSMAGAATHALIELDDRVILVELDASHATPTGIYGSQSADLVWRAYPDGVAIPLPEGGLRPIAASLRASEIAGACERLLAMTVDYAGQRSQFGKPIGRQQAVQQQLALMAEQVMLARMAARIGCAGGFPPDPAATATAKLVSSKAAAEVGAIAHAIFGAIGLSAELDLQLYTRRLIEWRLADGSEDYWARILGGERLRGSRSTLDAIRAIDGGAAP
jgi:alkylation response protein AidB-like acyl-CoA dehydrogenase